MQGATNLGESKWTTTVNGYMQQVDFCSLQECGSIPGSVKSLEDKGNGVYVGLWQLSSNDYAYITFLNINSRCNLAVVSRAYPDQISVLQSVSNARHRPVLGCLFGNEWVFSIHAMSGSGNDVAGLVTAVSQHCQQADWVVAGDFNREPQNLQNTPGVPCPPDKPTHPKAYPVSKFDYLIKSGGQSRNGQVQNNTLSDHYPVYYVVA